MRTAIAVFLSLLFLVSSGLLTEGMEFRADLDEDAEEEGSVDDFNISPRSNHSGRSRSRQVRSPVKPSGSLLTRVADFFSDDRIKTLSWFSQQELYRLQKVYRL